MGTLAAARSHSCCPPHHYPIVDIPVTHHDVSDRVQSEADSAGAGDQRVAPARRRHLRARIRQRRSSTRAGIFDEKGRLMVLMTHNTDISDTWEREGEDVEYFYRFSPEGYAIAINVMFYVMTH